MSECASLALAIFALVISSSSLAFAIFTDVQLRRRRRMPPPLTLSIWTVYDHPRDYPDSWVARRVDISRQRGVVMTSEMFLADSLEELRALLPPGLARIARSPMDDPKIAETWI
jgi:hypothetical protein